MLIIQLIHGIHVNAKASNFAQLFVICESFVVTLEPA
jgi:hypothetical protein